MPETISRFNEDFQRLHFPEGRRAVSVMKAEGKFLHDWVKEHQLTATLEIGLGFGASAVSIVSAHEGIHTCIDPYQDKDFQDVGVKNLEALGYSNRIVFYREPSHSALPRLWSEGKKYDFVFIDGDHRFDSVFVDFYYADLLLSINGYIILHDSWMRSTQLVAAYIRRNRSNYVQIRNAGPNLIVLQKSGRRSNSAWDEFHEFYTLRGVLSNLIIPPIIRFFNKP